MPTPAAAAVLPSSPFYCAFMPSAWRRRQKWREGGREARPPFVPSSFCFRRLRPRRSLHPWRDRGREEQSALQTRAERGRESGEAALSLHFTSLSRPLLPLLSSVGRPFLIALEGQTSEQREIEGDGVRRRPRPCACVRPSWGEHALIPARPIRRSHAPPAANLCANAHPYSRSECRAISRAPEEKKVGYQEPGGRRTG